MYCEDVVWVGRMDLLTRAYPIRGVLHGSHDPLGMLLLLLTSRALRAQLRATLRGEEWPYTWHCSLMAPPLRRRPWRGVAAAKAPRGGEQEMMASAVGAAKSERASARLLAGRGGSSKLADDQEESVLAASV